MKPYIFKYLSIMLILIFGLSVFWGNERPLLWNDESETAMYGQRILDYGYPKVHDEKNIVNLTNHWDKGLGVKEEIDAWIHLGWGQYYVAAFGVILANQVNDIFIKTWLVKFPFALLGFMGTLIIGMIIYQFKIREKIQDKLFNVYLALEIFSVYLALHISEARYYSLVIFFTALGVFMFFKYKLKKLNYIYYLICIIISFFALMFSYIPAFLALFLSLGIIEIYFYWLSNDNAKKLLINLIPFIIAPVIFIPIISFFEYFKISSEFSKLLLQVRFGIDYFPLELYFNNIYIIVDFFIKNEFLFTFITFKLILLILLLKKKKLSRKFLTQNNLISFSIFLLIYIVITILILSRIPSLFSRYFLVLQPLISVSIVTDYYILIKFYKFNKEYVKAFSIILGFSLLFSLIFKLNDLINYGYELTHKYVGPVDMAIEEIIKRYDKPQDIVIATNYEELVYMFYLNSKMIVGGVGNNLRADMKVKPDVIIPRKDWSYLNELGELKSSSNYEEVVLPIYDNKFNNIPEPSIHLFKTKYATNKSEALKIYFVINEE